MTYNADELHHLANHLAKKASLPDATGAVLVRNGDLVGSGWDMPDGDGIAHAAEVIYLLFRDDLADGALVVFSQCPCEDCVLMLAASGCCGVMWPDGGNVFDEAKFNREWLTKTPT